MEAAGEAAPLPPQILGSWQGLLPWILSSPLPGDECRSGLPHLVAARGAGLLLSFRQAILSSSHAVSVTVCYPVKPWMERRDADTRRAPQTPMPTIRRTRHGLEKLWRMGPVSVDQ